MLISSLPWFNHFKFDIQWRWNSRQINTYLLIRQWVGTKRNRSFAIRLIMQSDHSIWKWKAGIVLWNVFHYAIQSYLHRCIRLQVYVHRNMHPMNKICTVKFVFLWVVFEMAIEGFCWSLKYFERLNHPKRC